MLILYYQTFAPITHRKTKKSHAKKTSSNYHGQHGMKNLSYLTGPILYQTLKLKFWKMDDEVKHF